MRLLNVSRVTCDFSERSELDDARDTPSPARLYACRMKSLQLLSKGLLDTTV